MSMELEPLVASEKPVCNWFKIRRTNVPQASKDMTLYIAALRSDKTELQRKDLCVYNANLEVLILRWKKISPF